jgi:hypothetical protein
MDKPPGQADNQDMTHGDNTHAELLAEVDEALADKPKTFRQEMRDVIHAPKDSELGKARRTLGWGLILFGIFGVSILFFGIVLVAAVIGSIF